MAPKAATVPTPAQKAPFFDMAWAGDASAAAMVMAATAAIAVLRMVVIGLFPLLSSCSFVFRVNHVDVSEHDGIVILAMCNPSHVEIRLHNGHVTVCEKSTRVNLRPLTVRTN